MEIFFILALPSEVDGNILQSFLYVVLDAATDSTSSVEQLKSSLVTFYCWIFMYKDYSVNFWGLCYYYYRVAIGKELHHWLLFSSIL